MDETSLKGVHEEFAHTPRIEMETEIAQLRDRLAQIEGQVRELSDKIDHAAKYEAYHNREGNAFVLQYWGVRVRAIIDPSDGEG